MSSVQDRLPCQSVGTPLRQRTGWGGGVERNCDRQCVVCVCCGGDRDRSNFHSRSGGLKFQDASAFCDVSALGVVQSKTEEGGVSLCMLYRDAGVRRRLGFHIHTVPNLISAIPPGFRYVCGGRDIRVRACACVCVRVGWRRASWGLQVQNVEQGVAGVSEPCCAATVGSARGSRSVQSFRSGGGENL